MVKIVSKHCVGLLLLLLTPLVCGSSLDIHTTKGKVRGITTTAANGLEVDAWYGIPYAQPPTGNLRFRHPHPIKAWAGFLNTDQLPNSCYQIMDTYYGDFKGATKWNANTNRSEDCLYLSVFAPKPRPKKAAVMVWIYGGGFYSGTSTLDLYDYKILASETNVIVVGIQYRVASLGFLYTGSNGAVGNAGMFDQLMALQWIKDNIQYFGGDPDRITLFGESAGAASVGMHLISPLSRNLFSRGILQSGSATGPWVLMSKEEAIARGLQMAEAVRCPHTANDTEATVDCLRAANVTDLVYNEPWHNHVVNFPFVPIIDGAFLTENPIESLRKTNFKQTSLLLGSNTEEGNIFLLYFFPDILPRQEYITISRKQFEDLVKKLHPQHSDIIHEVIIHEYTNWLFPNNDRMNMDALDKMVGDYYFTCGVNEVANQYALDGNDVYMYYFTHRSSQSYWPKWCGVLHADEINFVFGEPFNQKYAYTDQEKTLSKRMMTYWTNFAKTGNPNLSEDGVWMKEYWPLYNTSKKEYLPLDTKGTPPGKGLRLRQCQFWKQLVPQLLQKIEMQNTKSQNEKPSICPEKISKCPAELKSSFVVDGKNLHFTVSLDVSSIVNDTTSLH